MEISDRGLPVVISGPAGTGKGTVVGNILARSDNFTLSVSATTRQPRPGEIDGVQYSFITREQFEQAIGEGRMLEYTLYCGNYYGTPRENVEKYLDEGISVILEIEVEGAMNVKRLCPDAVLILLLPPDYKTLEARLRGRGTSTEEDIQNRLSKARTELENYNSYDYVVINEDGMSDDAALAIINIVESERCRVSRNPQIPAQFFSEES